MVAAPAGFGPTFGIPGTLAKLLERLPRACVVDEARSALVDEAGAVSSRPGFDTLLCGGRLAFEPFDYQLQTAQTVLRRMRGRAILADEVGLGKTIEAGLVLSELRMRGLADRALVITPAGLVDQWREELERKFGLPTAIARTGAADGYGPRPAGRAGVARRRPPRPAALGLTGSSGTWSSSTRRTGSATRAARRAGSPGRCAPATCCC